MKCKQFDMNERSVYITVYHVMEWRVYLREKYTVCNDKIIPFCSSKCSTNVAILLFEGDNLPFQWMHPIKFDLKTRKLLTLIALGQLESTISLHSTPTRKKNLFEKNLKI